MEYPFIIGCLVVIQIFQMKSILSDTITQVLFILHDL